MRNMSNKFGGAIQGYEYCIVWIRLSALFIDYFSIFKRSIIILPFLKYLSSKKSPEGIFLKI